MVKLAERLDIDDTVITAEQLTELVGIIEGISNKYGFSFENKSKSFNSEFKVSDIYFVLSNDYYIVTLTFKQDTFARRKGIILFTSTCSFRCVGYTGEIRDIVDSLVNIQKMLRKIQGRKYELDVYSRFHDTTFYDGELDTDNDGFGGLA